MSSLSRPGKRSDGSAVKTAEEGGGEAPPVSAAGASAQTSRSKAPNEAGNRSRGHAGSIAGDTELESPSWSGVKSSNDGLRGFQTRSIFRSVRRSSSGYFSYEGDSLPSSPLSPRPVTADKATQTPSPSGQVMTHALERMAEAHGGGPGARRHEISSPASIRPANAAGDMQAESIGRELRRIGDDYYNTVLMRGRLADGHRPDMIQPNQLPPVHAEPAILICMGLLLLLIGRILYYSHQEPSQV